MTDQSTIRAATPRLLKADGLTATLEGADLTHVRLGSLCLHPAMVSMRRHAAPALAF